MKKRIFILVSILFSVLFINTFCFATTPTPANLQDAGNSIKNTAQDAGNNVKNAAQDTGNNIKNGIQNLGNDVREGIQNGENAVENTAKDMTNNGNNTNDGYNAVRTATTGNANTGNTVWTWVILAAIAIVIIGLIWYYASQNTHNKNDR